MSEFRERIAWAARDSASRAYARHLAGTAKEIASNSHESGFIAGAEWVLERLEETEKLDRRYMLRDVVRGIVLGGDEGIRE